MLAKNQEIDEINHQLTEDYGKLVPRHECSTHVARRHLGDIHRTDGRSQTYAYATKHTVGVESPQQRNAGLAVFKEQELGIV